jgi:uncharacterized protein (DUF952 family)
VTSEHDASNPNGEPVVTAPGTGNNAAQMVYKIVPGALWRASEPSGVFTGSPIDVLDGYIHLSTAHQVRETAARHFAGIHGLLLVAVTTTALNVRWEPSRDGDLFPHLYGSLPFSAVSWVAPLAIGHDGRHAFPAGMS